MFFLWIFSHQESKLSAAQLTGKIIRERGIFALYNGISASLLRQLTYSTTRFGLYEVGKQDFGNSFVGKVLLAGASGAAGGKHFHTLIFSNFEHILNFSLLFMIEQIFLLLFILFCLRKILSFEEQQTLVVVGY